MRRLLLGVKARLLEIRVRQPAVDFNTIYAPNIDAFVVHVGLLVTDDDDYRTMRDRVFEHLLAGDGDAFTRRFPSEYVALEVACNALYSTFTHIHDCDNAVVARDLATALQNAEAKRLARVAAEEEGARRAAAEAARLRAIVLREQRRRAEEEQREAARMQAEAEYRQRQRDEAQRKEKEKRRRINAALQQFMREIDWYVRHRNDFLAPGFWCPIAAIVGKCGERPRLADIPRTWTLVEIVKARAGTAMSLSQCGKFLRLNHLTPHRVANERRFGRFHCVKCGRSWMSANSWADSWQQCVRCEVEVYPFQQDELQRPDSDDDANDSERPPHPMELCERCQALGHSCVLRR
jgi:hypothetical protein